MHQLVQTPCQLKKLFQINGLRAHLEPEALMKSLLRENPWVFVATRRQELRLVKKMINKINHLGPSPDDDTGGVSDWKWPGVSSCFCSRR